MGTFWPDGGRRIKHSDFFIGVQWTLLHVLLINVAIIYDTALSDYVVFRREGWDEFTSTHPYLHVSAALSSHEGAEKVCICKGPPYLPHPSTKTRNNKFCIYITLVNPSVELKLLYGSAQFDGEMKSAKDMSAQVLVRDLHFGNMDGDNDPTPLNAESYHFDNSLCRCRRNIVSPNNSPSRCCRFLTSDNPSEAVDYCASTPKEILRSMALKVFIRPRTPRSGLGVIKVQEEKRER